MGNIACERCYYYKPIYSDSGRYICMACHYVDEYIIPNKEPDKDCKQSPDYER